MNLQTFAGVARGATRRNAYDGSRLEPVASSRLFEDAGSAEEWRTRGFFDVVHGGEKSLLWRFIAMNDRRLIYPAEPTRLNLTCVETSKETELIERHKPEYGMPYALPSLNSGEKALIQKWVKAGAPGREEKLSLAGLGPLELKIVKEWQTFLNAKDMKSRVLARYLFEHFFIAHFYFPNNTKTFLRLVRSSTACDNAVIPVRARMPNDDPGVNEWSYCFYVDPASVIYKKHVPYELSLQKLSWLKNNFSRDAWSAKTFPSFKEDVSRNPFVTFKDIPVRARYRFLLEDARYHIMTFIKGPVCNGSFAVNSIQEQFTVLFMDPRADVTLQDPEFARNTANLMILPGNFDAETSVGKIFDDYATLTTFRNDYRKLKSAVIKKLHPAGLALSDIWDGDAKNPNALLTVFRHDDNAEVLYGAKGDVAKTAFLLDYSIFERLVYNLVVNFDVFGNVKHQALTRLYMDMIRMEAENNYLEFLPPAERLPLKRSWYQGALTSLKLDIMNEDQFPDIPTQVKLPAGKEPHRELLSRILFERMNEKVRGPDDHINWRLLKDPAPLPDVSPGAAFRQMASIKVKEGAGYAKLFPEFSILALKRNGEIVKLYSIIRNREHLNISWMFAESFRLDPENDSLSILEGIHGSYPNKIFVFEESEALVFTKKVQKIKRQRDYDAFVRDYGLSRRDPQFWFHFDAIQALFKKTDSLEAGALDLSRLDMEIQ